MKKHTHTHKRARSSLIRRRDRATCELAWHDAFRAKTLRAMHAITIDIITIAIIVTGTPRRLFETCVDVMCECVRTIQKLAYGYMLRYIGRKWLDSLKLEACCFPRSIPYYMQNVEVPVSGISATLFRFATGWMPANIFHMRVSCFLKTLGRQRWGGFNALEIYGLGSTGCQSRVALSSQETRKNMTDDGHASKHYTTY